MIGFYPIYFMKLTKKTINLLIFLFAIIVSYFLNQQEKSKPAQTTTSNTAQQAVKNSYDIVMADDKYGQNATAPVDYYMLVLSWSPSFCEAQREKNNGKIPEKATYQCASDKKFGWVIHGLWAQNKNARTVEDHPRFCQGDLPSVSPQIIEKYLPESPGASLLQGEWEKHGACAFNDPESYFAKQKALFDDLALPDTWMRNNELFRWMRKNNPQLDRVYLGASKNELYICYDKKWNVMDCPR